MIDISICGIMIIVPVIIVYMYIKHQGESVFPLVVIPLFSLYVYFLNKIFPYIQKVRSPKLIICLGVGLVIPTLFCGVMLIKKLLKD